MKKTLLAFSFLLLGAAAAHSQEIKKTTVIVKEEAGDTVSTTIITDTVQEGGRKRKVAVTIGTNGIEVKRKKTVTITSDSVQKKPDPRLKIQWGMVDLGFNRLDDKTPAANIPANMNHNDVFKLREGKSVNVNVWIVNGRLRLSETRRQKWYMTSGLGLQMYNFRFENPYQYTKSSPEYPTLIDSTRQSFQKNKLGFTYASIPLGLLGKTRIGDKWLVYGGGVMGGLRLASWTKLKTDRYGKEKDHDAFDFRNFNAGVYAEVGVDDIIRLYGTYQLTPLQKSGVEQYPFAIGVRFLGL